MSESKNENNDNNPSIHNVSEAKNGNDILAINGDK